MKLPGIVVSVAPVGLTPGFGQFVAGPLHLHGASTNKVEVRVEGNAPEEHP